MVPSRPSSSLLVPQVRYHDIHHWYPECNYGQYTMLWDWVMGSLKPYPEESNGDGVNGQANGAKEKAG